MMPLRRRDGAILACRVIALRRRELGGRELAFALVLALAVVLALALTLAAALLARISVVHITQLRASAGRSQGGTTKTGAKTTVERPAAKEVRESLVTSSNPLPSLESFLFFSFLPRRSGLQPR